MKSLIPFHNLSSIQDNYDVFIFDIWGVIIEEGVAYEGVVDFLNEFSQSNEVLYLTNSPRPVPQVQETLKGIGITNLKTESIFTSGSLAAEMLSNASVNFSIDKPVIFHLGHEQNPTLISHIHSDVKITQNPDEANIILLSIHLEQGDDLDKFDDLFKKIANRNDTISICMNPDVTIPAGAGHLRYCAGFFADKIEKFGGKVIYTGKPKVEIYNKLFTTLNNVPQERILMIGDTLDKDVQGAINANIHSALTLSGNALLLCQECHNKEEQIKHLSNIANKSNMLPNFITELK